MAKKKPATTKAATATTVKEQSPEVVETPVTTEAPQPEGETQDLGQVAEGTVVVTDDAVQTTADVQEAPEAPEAQPAQAPEVQEVQEAVEVVEVVEVPTGSPAFQGVINSINSYVENMAPNRPMDAVAGARHQLGLYGALTAMLALKGKELDAAVAYLLDTIKEHRKGVFSERLVFRFIADITLPAPRSREFQALLNLFLQAATSGRKNAAAKVDLEATASLIRDGGRQQALLALFS